MTVLCFVDDDELSAQAAGFARTIGDVRAVTIDGDASHDHLQRWTERVDHDGMDGSIEITFHPTKYVEII